ncbi:unnamed protein product [Caenorhabditis auriculariae]|uniref:Uncharacterized protein n=1 Tax=Caenorhabditis auriculariae TaxID=2777116 RepID=A0A8S1HF05_9PELO|nr:unnamed protein product [Caenorhabditis auriculariae]
MDIESGGASLLAVNRLKSYERDGQLLLRRPLVMDGAGSSASTAVTEFSEQMPNCSTGTPVLVSNGAGSTPRPSGLIGGSRNTSAFHVANEMNGNEYPTNSRYGYSMNIDEEAGEHVTVIQPGGSRDNDETDIEEELSHPYTCKQLIVPSKSQVLFYVSTSTRLRLNHTGTELQVTDPSDFPLLDIWSENVCDETPVWIIESYGRRVAVVSDMTPRSLLSVFLPFMRPRRTLHSGFSVIDWNGDVIGYYCLGDPIEIQDTRREPIARCFCESDNGDAWRVMCEAAPQRQLARLDANGALKFGDDLTLPLKILLIATLSRAVMRRTRSSCFPLFR